ncbi:MAG: hypothetical protein NT169_11255 [Chloroflexi bacterium]|nr:hypothetical protein [Chloroflexota bacterium]
MTVNTVTIELPRPLYVRLETLAKEERTDLIDLLSRLATSAAEPRPRSKPSTLAFQRILDRATDLGVSDLAEQHDHYLYGVEKQ